MASVYSSDRSAKQDLDLDLDAAVALFHQIKLGRSQALATLYDRHSALVYGLALRILQNRQEAEDLTQEIFLQIWHKPNYEPQRGTVAAYLATITRSRALDKIRSRGVLARAQQKIGQFLETTHVATPLEQTIHHHQAEMVQRALSHLTSDQQQVLTLAYFGGMSQSAIAKHLNLPLGTVKSWCRQGLIKLRQELQNLHS
ncbi:MAG: sigma-70 family RNA polymerase sigma factor [Pseudanabaenaceae cyanobacterium bins.68]|nr:sigma-70 family RNA polymerase sigma factor [Pseudanabaenaceae cyanobacterium bins.68]